MLYIHEKDLVDMGICWNDTIDVVAEAIELIAVNDYNQPIKPYLRFRDNANRIIAMPAFIGGHFFLAGIKWIASFPQNKLRDFPRAHSVTILNDASTGKPVCIINTSRISAIRTASLSGYIIREFMKSRDTLASVDLGIVGFGPIGQLHLEMAHCILGDKIRKVFIFDINETDVSKVPQSIRGDVIVCNGWQEPYANADIFITATVSQSAYIDTCPKPGSLLLNVSLRDFKPMIMHHVNKILVDNWEEVCRENTDIENMHRVLGLQKKDTHDLTDFIDNDPFTNLKRNETVMFNPMGMAVFDIAMGGFYYKLALQRGIGTKL